MRTSDQRALYDAGYWLLLAVLIIAPSLMALDPSKAITQHGLSG